MAEPALQISSLDGLLEKAAEQEFVTIDDILEAYPEVEEDLAQLEELFIYLQSHDIPVFGDVQEARQEMHARSRGGEEKAPEEEAGEEPMDLSDLPGTDPISLYFHEMGRVPLLTHEEEQGLAKTLERGRLAQKRLSRNGHNRIERKELLRQMEAGRTARERLIRANTRLVVSVAKRYVGQGVPLPDLIQEGNLGLMRAVGKFDYRRGYKFSTYATWWIRQAVSRAVSDQGRTIRLPVHMGDSIRRLYRTIHQLEQEQGRPPAPEEIATAMELDPRRVRWMLRVSRHPLSLEQPVGEEEDSELGSFIKDEDSTPPPDAADQSLLRDKLEDLLDTLSPREARILRLRFGLQDGHYYTLEEVGRKFDLTRERIRQIEAQALNRLRHPRRSRQLRDYLA